MGIAKNDIQAPRHSGPSITSDLEGKAVETGLKVRVWGESRRNELKTPTQPSAGNHEDSKEEALSKSCLGEVACSPESRS